MRYQLAVSALAVLAAMGAGIDGSALAGDGRAAFAAGGRGGVRVAERVVYAFDRGRDGGSPFSSLIDVGGALYGTTYWGGGSVSNCVLGCGTVFAVNPTTGAETLVYNFNPGGGAGGNPVAGLLDVDGTLYGTTYFGDGAVFSVDPSDGAEAVTYSFTGYYNSDGQNPEGGLIDLGGTLYGTTYRGGADTGPLGAAGLGTVFAVDRSTGAERVLHSFSGRDGALPLSSLLYLDGMLYGTTQEGGASSAGTVFAVNPRTGTERVVYSFKGGSDGEAPFAGLIDVGGRLYGTTSAGGSFGAGTVFSVNPGTGAERVVHSFDGSDGSGPEGGLIDVHGLLFGTAAFGGDADCPQGCGTVYAVDPTSGAVWVVYFFKGGVNDGADPAASLIDVGGTLYGTTAQGGSFDGGTVFAIRW
jgi:uncharacterized repeat protein (TIGR03803 family)